MRTWNLHTGDPLELTLAADQRLGPTDYANDQIWEMSLGRGEPPSLAIQTTFGLRARSLRIFPRFILGDSIQTEPARFASPIRVRRLYPNFLRLSFMPHTGINAEIEYWVPTSHSLAGRTQLTNTTTNPISLRVEWVSLLNPDPDGQRISPTMLGITHVLAGRTGGLVPVFYLTGVVEPGSGPYTALASQINISAGQTQTITWAHAALTTLEASLELAQQVASRNWEAESTRIELTNSDQLEVITGSIDWDIAFTLAQNTARRLVVSNPAGSPNPSTVATRQPDQGYSQRGDGTDYTHSWDGQTPFDLDYLLGLLLPGNPDLVRGFLENFFATQTSNGELDWKPGLAGQRGSLLAPPLLAGITWEYYQVSGNQEFLEKFFPHLLAFVQSWFSTQHDRDSDGIPEWDHAMQTGIEDHPIFAHWQPWSQGLDITTVESPDLCALLFREIKCLVQIATIVSRPETIPALESLADHLRAAVEASWDEDLSVYRHWDRESHSSSSLITLGSRQGPGIIQVTNQFAQPVRLLIRVSSTEQATRQAQGFIHGFSSSGDHRVERLLPERFRWQMGVGRCTSDRIYSGLEHVDIQGIQDSDQVMLQTTHLDLREQSSLLPLWAGIPSPERAAQLIKNTLTNRRIFWTSYGVRSCAEKPDTPEASSFYQRVYPYWNTLFGEGLVRYHQRSRAADLVSRVMKAIVQNLKNEAAFRHAYLGSTGAGQGERNSLLGLAPLGLFLQVLGVQIISPQTVKISGPNPFPWTVTIKYKGLTVIQQKKKAMIIFPNGQSITIRNDLPQVVSSV